MTKPINIKFFRYMRPYQQGWDDLSPHNLGGTTFCFNINYDERNVNVGFSVCAADENFNKTQGRTIAEQFAIYNLNLDTFQKFADECGGFTFAFLDYIRSQQATRKLSSREKALLKGSGV